MASELGILEMKSTIDKSGQFQTYNYLLAKNLKRKSQEHSKELDKELHEYTRGGKKASSKEAENGQGHLKWKQPVKETRDRLEITEDDSQEKVADEISFRFQEPKKDLIA